MKLLPTVVLASAVAVSGAAIARPVKISNLIIVEKSVTYRCQQGKHVTVTYDFNKQGLTTFTSAVVNGKRRFMSIDLDCSDNADTYYDKEDGYVLNTAYIGKKTYCKQLIMITTSDDEIVLKNCSPC